MPEEEISVASLEDTSEKVHVFGFPPSWDAEEIENFADYMRRKEPFQFSGCLFLGGRIGCDDEEIEVISTTEEELEEFIDG